MTRVAGKTEAAVFDASPLIFLARLDLLREALGLFAPSVVATSVREEVVDIGRQIGAPETVEIERAFGDRSLMVEVAPETALGRRLESNTVLSRADRDSLVLAAEMKARLLADDAAVRSVARRLRIRLGGTFYVLFVLVEKESLGPRDAVEHLDRLIDLGWSCSASLYRSARALLEGRIRT